MSHQEVAVDAYLQDVTNSLEESVELFCLPLQQQHCKSMLRALTGLDKVQVEQELRTLRTALQWQATQAFVAQHGDALVAAANNNKDGDDNDDAPQCTAESMAYIPAYYAQRPAKFFTFLANGRVYQGQFERLLQTLQPTLLPAFEDIFRPRSEQEILCLWVDERIASMDDDAKGKDETRQLLRDCLQMDYAPPPAQPIDGGKRAGSQGEDHLLSYLEQQQQQQQQQQALGTNDDLEILAPVWIRRRCNKPVPPRCDYVLELPSNFDLHGMTSELDAIVVQFHDNNNGDLPNSVRLVQVWEAKATLNPATLQDALSKKSRTIAAICENDCTLLVKNRNERYAVDTTTTTTTWPPLRLGILGTRLVSPQAAARQVLTVLAEAALETDPAVVRQALQQGHVTVPRDSAMAAIQRVSQLAQRLDPMVVVAVASNQIGETASDESE